MLRRLFTYIMLLSTLFTHAQCIQVHHPGTDDVKAYKAMEKYHVQGKIHALGISCFYAKELTDFLPKISIKPVLVQNEIHPYYQDTEVVDFIHNKGVVVQAWYPLGGTGHQNL